MGCNVIQAVCLRSPDNAKQVMEAGGAQLLTQIIKTHTAAPKILVSFRSYLLIVEGPRLSFRAVVASL